MNIKPIALALAANDGQPDNLKVTPGGGDLYLQIRRGFNSVINRYRVDIQQANAAGGWNPATDPAHAEGTVPAAGHPNEALVLLGAPASLQNRRTVLLTGAISLPPGTPGEVDVTIAILQLQPGGANYRRVEWEADSAHNLIELLTRFEITLT